MKNSELDQDSSGVSRVRKDEETEAMSQIGEWGDAANTDPALDHKTQ